MQKKEIYLDYQSTTPTCENALKAMEPYIKENFANPHSNHLLGIKCKKAIDEAREKIASMINADRDEIIFTSGATESNNLAIKSIPQVTTHRYVVTQSTEHKCILQSCVSLLRDKKINLQKLRPKKNGIIDLNELEECFKKIDKGTQTSMYRSFVSIMAANNEIGVIQPIREIAELCKKYNAIFHTDAVQAVGTIKIDVKEMDIDSLSLSSHKIYGPKGIGVIYLNKKFFYNIDPILDGGGQEMRVRSGTLPTALCVGMGEACEHISKNREQFINKIIKVRDLFLKELRLKVGEVIINGDLKQRICNNLNLYIPNINADELMAHIPHIAISTGSACTALFVGPSNVLTELDIKDDHLEGSFRIGFSHLTTESEVITAAQDIGIAVKKLRQLDKKKIA